MSHLSDTSLVSVAKQDATRAAGEILADVVECRKAAREKTIVDVLATHRINTGWFKSRPITRPEAERMVDEASQEILMDDNWRLAEWRRVKQGNETLAKRFISAAHLSQDGCIWLNLAEADCVASWLPKP